MLFFFVVCDQHIRVDKNGQQLFVRHLCDCGFSNVTVLCRCVGVRHPLQSTRNQRQRKLRRWDRQNKNTAVFDFLIWFRRSFPGPSSIHFQGRCWVGEWRLGRLGAEAVGGAGFACSIIFKSTLHWTSAHPPRNLRPRCLRALSANLLLWMRAVR